MFAVISTATCAPAPAHTAPRFQRGINITRLFDAPIIRDGTYADPVFLPWTHELSQNELTQLRDTGFNFIRLPVDPGPFITMDNASRAKALSLLSDFLNAAMQSGFAVIVDLHPRLATPWSPAAILDAPDGPHFAQYEQFAEQLAHYLQTKNTSQLALELMNEPQSSCVRTNGADWTVFQSKLYADIRATVRKLPLVVTGGCYSSVDGLSNLNLQAFPDRNLYVMVHFYDPFDFTHQGASWSPYTRYIAGLRYPVRQQDEASAEAATQAWISHLGLIGAAYDTAVSQADGQLRSYFSIPYDRSIIDHRFDIAARWADSMRLSHSRIIVGEFGVMNEGGGLGSDGADVAARADWLHDVSSSADAHGFGWAVWGYHGAFGIVSDDPARTLDSSVTAALFKH
ncbi:MAG: cellulase family glycosylhydrolase [Alphaproteobacteria bacterium]|nr:cellulase family glycosylhydrolase [Alphaproteobacteria bacterium]